MHEEPRHRPRVPRGRARDTLIGAARDLLAEATLDDLTAFVTVSRLRSRTGLSSGAIYSAFSPGAGVGSRTRSAPQNVARHAVLDAQDGVDPLPTATADLLDAVIGEARRHPDELLVEAVADAVAGVVARGARGDMAWEYSQMWLGAAVGLNDPDVARVMVDAFRRSDRTYASLLGSLLELTDREPVDGLDVDRLATLLAGAVDGMALRARADDSVPERCISQLIVAVWAGATRRAGDEDELLGHRVAVRTAVPFDADEHAAVLAAVRRVHERAGWPAVTLRKVAQLAGISDARLAGRFAGRDQLAVLVWDDLVAATERRAATRRDLPASQEVGQFVRDVADLACSERALVASLCAARLHDASGLEERSRPDPTERLVVLLADRLAAAVDDGVAGDDRPASHAAAVRTAGLSLDGLLMRAATSSIRADELAEGVLVGLTGAATQ